MSLGVVSMPSVGCHFWKRFVVSTRCANPNDWLNTAGPATALPMASWKRTASVWVGLLSVVVMPGLMASILHLSVSREMRHESSAVLLMVEIESLSVTAPVSASAVVLEWLELSSAGALQWLLVWLLWLLLLLLLLLLLSLWADPSIGAFPAMSGCQNIAWCTRWAGAQARNQSIKSSESLSSFHQ